MSSEFSTSSTVVEQSTPLDHPVALPPVALSEPDAFAALSTREDILRKKKALRSERQDAQRHGRHARTTGPSVAAQDSLLEEDRLETMLQDRFIPQHGPQQLISPRAFFLTPLFCVRSKAVERARYIEMTLASSADHHTLTYSGPELRQSDGLVFMALLNMARDVPAGKLVSFHPEEACRAIFGRYDGPSRKRLREHVQRLQRALLKFDTFSVQLCQRFDYPNAGRWTVALDSQIVELFRHTAYVWLDLKRRLSLPEGLATWLYAFVESQTRLIPTRIETLREMCGSEASLKPFTNKLRDALRALVAHHVIDEGWFMESGTLHWRKATWEPGPAQVSGTEAVPA